MVNEIGYYVSNIYLYVVVFYNTNNINILKHANCKKEGKESCNNCEDLPA